MKVQIADGQITKEGYFVGRARVTGVGVLDYTKVYGVWIFRPLAEVTKPESMDSLKLQPITFSHPPENVDSGNAEEVTIGWTGENVEFEESTQSLIINFKITAGWAVELIQNAMAAGQRVQFSIGADAKPVFESGTYNGQEYQVWLKDIIYNHLALLIGEDGRYPITEIITDSKAADKDWVFIFDAQFISVDSNTTEVQTVKIKLPSGFEVEINDSEAPHVQNLVKDFSELQDKFAAQKADLANAQKAGANLLDSKGVEKLLQKRRELAEEAAQLCDSEAMDLMLLDDAGIYEAVLLDNGFSQEELASEKTELKDSYSAFLKASYRSVKKASASGEAESSEITDAASGTSKSKADAHIVTLDSAASAKKIRERMDKRAKGEIA